MSHLFAYLSKMKFIQRWGLKRNSSPENIQEHSYQVAIIAHALAIIKNRIFGGKIDPDRVAVLALFHDVSEVLTGDLPTPIKYFNPQINTAYKEIEKVAVERLFSMLPEEFKQDYEPIFFAAEDNREAMAIVKEADVLCAYLKCIEEVNAGNHEFSTAESSLKNKVEQLKLPEVRYFMERYVPSFKLTLDELN
ncbi:MAG: 5'-deoxynucleotidase [Deltaproteobacteria bacterium RIFCSPHIGHO2_12_FULL_43_9]|nr:MAG: 5'-deoxynucleotidase [Deltaproteobacteria bacterium RIFCSPHIGHO2_12_FULL_43_9]